MRTLARLAAALGTTPEWLTSGTGPEETGAYVASQSIGRPSGLRLAGTVAAGIWSEMPSVDSEQQSTLVPADPRYLENYQSAFEVRGTSIDRIAHPGDFLIVVDREAAGLPLRSGDIVMVTVTKQGLQEVTARRFQGNPPNCELVFESTDARYNAFPPLNIRATKDEPEISFRGIAVAVYRPLL